METLLLLVLVRISEHIPKTFHKISEASFVGVSQGKGQEQVVFTEINNTGILLCFDKPRKVYFVIKWNISSTLLPCCFYAKSLLTGTFNIVDGKQLGRQFPPGSDFWFSQDITCGSLKVPMKSLFIQDSLPGCSPIDLFPLPLRLICCVLLRVLLTFSCVSRRTHTQTPFLFISLLDCLCFYHWRSEGQTSTAW